MDPVAPPLRDMRMEDKNMARTAASTARKTPTKAAAAPATPAAPADETAAPLEAPADEAPASETGDVVEQAAAETAQTAEALGAALGGAPTGEPIVTIEAPDAEVTPEAPVKEAAPAASTAPLEAPAPREQPQEETRALTPVDSLGAKAAATGSRQTLRVLDDETGEELTAEDLADLFVSVNANATVVRSSRRLLREVTFPPYSSTTRVLLVAKGVTLARAEADVIEALIAPPAGD